MKIPSRRTTACLVVTAALLCLVVGACEHLKITNVYKHGAVATAAPIATEIGRTVLENGGNAFDAAVAVGFTLAVVHPEAGNIGGGGFAVIREVATGRVRALDFREIAPAAASEAMFLNDSGAVTDDLSLTGALAGGVPGTVAGLLELWSEHGSLPWEELVATAAALADTGFIVDAYLAQSFDKYRAELKRFDETAAIFQPDGRPLTEGERFVQIDLAKTLYAIAAEGKDGFYSGEVAENISSAMVNHGGLITKDDLKNYTARWRSPIHFSFDGYDIYSMPLPSSGGLAIGQILKILEPFDFGRFFPDSPEYVHLFCEASRLAFADRSKHLGDADFYKVPKTLLDSLYLQQRRDLIDTNHTSPAEQVAPGSPPLQESEQTTHFSVCDAAGNMVAITYTINTAYGSKLVMAGAGFLLNNEMDDFSIKPGVANTYGLIGGEANKIEPSKRMLSSMSPTLVLEGGQPRLILGSPGGSKIITTVAQALLGFIRFDQTPAEICAQPRFHHQWLPDKLFLEEGSFDINTVQGLIRFGHNVTDREAYGDLQIIQIDKNGLMIAASDPRNRGSADGF